MLAETGDDGTPIAYNRVGGVVVTGNEDGAHHVISELSSNLSDIGFTIPGQAFTYWNKGPGPRRRLPRHEARAPLLRDHRQGRGLEHPRRREGPAGEPGPRSAVLSLNARPNKLPAVNVDGRRQAALPRPTPVFTPPSSSTATTFPPSWRTRAAPSEAEGGFRKSAVIHPEKPDSVVVVGLGKRDDFTPERARVAAAVAAQAAAKRKATSLAMAVPDERRRGGGRARPWSRARPSPRTGSTATSRSRSARTASDESRREAPPRGHHPPHRRRRRRRRRGRPGLQRGRQPRPRAAEPSLEPRDARPTSPSARSSSPSSTTR